MLLPAGPGVGVFGPRRAIMLPAGPGVGVFRPKGAILLPARPGKDILGPRAAFPSVISRLGLPPLACSWCS